MSTADDTFPPSRKKISSSVRKLMKKNVSSDLSSDVSSDVSSKATSKKRVAKATSLGLGADLNTDSNKELNAKELNTDVSSDVLLSKSSNQSAKDVIQKVKSAAKRLGKKVSPARPSVSKETMVAGVASEDLLSEEPARPVSPASAGLSVSDASKPEEIKTNLPVIQSKEAHRMLVLTEKIKQYHQEYNKVLPMEKIPAHVRRLQHDLHQYLGQCYEAVDSMDQLVEKIYRSNNLNVEQKSLFRESVVKVFGKNIFFHPTDPAIIIDVFALPVFGDVQSVHQLFHQKQTMAHLGDLVISGGYVDPRSKMIALLNVPLKSSAISRPEVLHTLSAVWGEYVFQRDKVDEKTGQEIIRTVLEDLKPHEAEDGMSGFVIPGVRVWVEGGQEYVNNNELMTRWSMLSEEEKVVPQFWWQLSAGRMIMKAGIKPGSLMIRPPVLPLVAQAQSLAWHLIQQVYERLGTAPFDEINFVSVAENKLALRAYDHRKRLIAQSDAVSLFEVTASPDDFSELMKYECDTRGPRTQLREIVRSLNAYRQMRE